MRNVLLIITCLICCCPLLAGSKIIIGIAGASGSGKTTLANNIQKAFPKNSILISQDSYYKDLSHLPKEEREKNNFDHPDSLDFEYMRKQLLALKEGQNIQEPVYNFSIHTRESFTKEIQAADIIIVEGILLLAVPEIRELFDIKFFVDADPDVCLLRRIERDLTERGRSLESIKIQYLTTVKPMFARFVAPSKQYADMIIPHGGQNLPALALIISKLQDTLAEDNTQHSKLKQRLASY